MNKAQAAKTLSILTAPYGKAVQAAALAMFEHMCRRGYSVRQAYQSAYDHARGKS